MARGKDAPRRVGGQIDPYVASSMQQSKQQAENRVLTAMRESGASQRAELASQTQLETQQMQSGTQLQAQAAQSAADDRRAGEAERGRREDMKFAEAMQKSTQAFQARQAALSKEHQIAIDEENWKRESELREDMKAERSVDRTMKMQAAERNTNTLMSIVTMGVNKEEREQKAQTTTEQQEKEFEQAKKVYELSKEKTVQRALSDKRLDLPVSLLTKEQQMAQRKGTMVEMGLKGMPGPVTAAIELGMGYGKLKRFIGKEYREAIDPSLKKDVADPMGVFQTQLSSYSKNVEVEWLSPQNIHKLDKAIQKGTVTKEDIISTLGVIEGMQEITENKISEYTLGSQEHDFWKKFGSDLFEMQDAIEGRADNRIDKVEGDPTNTVGSVVEKALGTIRNRSFGGQAAILRASGMDFPAMLAEMKKSMEPIQLYEYPEDTPERIKKVWDTRNMEMRTAFPERFGGIE